MPNNTKWWFSTKYLRGFINLQKFVEKIYDRLCGLMITVPGYRSRGPGFVSQHYQILWEVVGLERGPLSLVSVIEELLEW
jgi:hypothetical protein